MKRYFLHDGREQTGPFEFEELKKQVLTPELMVWHDGIPNWVNITMLEELKPLLVRPIIPPPFKGVAPPSKPDTKNILKPNWQIPKLNLDKTTLKRIAVGTAIALLLIFVIRYIVSPTKEYGSARNNKIRIGRTPHGNNTDQTEIESDRKTAKSDSKTSGKNDDNAIGDDDTEIDEDTKSEVEEQKKENEENERKNPLRFIEGEGNAKQSILGGKIIVNGTIKNKATVVTYTDFIVEISYLTAKKTFLSSEKKLIKEPVYAGEEIDFRFKLDPPEGAKSCVWKVTEATIGKSYRRVK